MYELTQRTFLTPGGRPVEMIYRADTNDLNTCLSCLDGDEYRTAPLAGQLRGIAVDVGAYLGAVAVGLAVDNPDLTVYAVEPVPSNVDLIRQNVALNGLVDRVEICDAAIGGREQVVISYGYRGTELAEHHAFVGNMSLLADHRGDVPHDERVMAPSSISQLIPPGPIALLKIDCEGCEWDALADRDLVARCARIVGEWHPTGGHGSDDISNLLNGFNVQMEGPPSGPAVFYAVAYGDAFGLVRRQMLEAERIRQQRLSVDIDQ
jgi:FkbM family methyltransferase